MAVCIAWILRRAASPSTAASPRALAADLRERRNSCVMLSAAMTAMRSVPLTLPASRISRMRRSRYATASSNSVRSLSLQATLNSRPRIATSRVIERSPLPSGLIQRSFGNPRDQGIDAGGRLLHARGELALAVVRGRELLAQRLVRRTQRACMRDERGQLLLERGEVVVHAGTIGGGRAVRQPRAAPLVASFDASAPVA